MPIMPPDGMPHSDKLLPMMLPKKDRSRLDLFAAIAKTFTIIVAVVSVIVAIALVSKCDMERINREHFENKQLMYSGWQKLHPEAKLTFQEWYALYMDGMIQ
jgi:hypothetical protein